MNSPYYNSGGGVSFMPPPGLGETLAQREKDTVENLGSIGKSLGGLAAGGMGAMQGAASPSTFGAGTSAGSGAAQGFAQNFLADRNGGGGGKGMGSFANMVQGGGEGGSTPNFKQLQQLGKSADSFREAAKHDMASLPGDDPKVFGKTDDEWKTLSARDRFKTVSDALEQKSILQAQQAGEMGYKKGLLDYEMKVKERDAETRFAGEARMAPITSGRGPVPTSFADLQQSAFNNPTAPSAAPFLREAAQADAYRSAHPAKRQFEPSGKVIEAGGWKIPGVMTSDGQFQPAMELATDGSGQRNTRYNPDRSTATANARLSAVTSALNKLYMLPTSQQVKPENARRISELENERRDLMGGASGGGASGGDDLWEQFLGTRK